MPFVVDSSVTMAWCFEDEATDYTDDVLRRLRVSSAIVPAIWPLEVANVLLVGERRRRITPSDTSRLTDFLRNLPIVVEDVVTIGATGSLFAAARAHGLSIYDTCYLDLAVREGLELATLDTKMLRAANAVGVPLV